MKASEILTIQLLYSQIEDEIKTSEDEGDNESNVWFTAQKICLHRLATLLKIELKETK